MSFEFHRFASVPARGIDMGSFFEAVGSSEFVIAYDFKRKDVLIGLDAAHCTDKILALEDVSAGVKLEPAHCGLFDGPRQLSVLSFYRKADEYSQRVMRDAMDLLHDGFLAAIFLPVGSRELGEAKRYIEERLSKRNVKEAYSLSKGSSSPRSSMTSHRDLFTGSEEAMLLGDVLESINNALLSNGLVYKTFFATQADASKVIEFIGTRFLVLDRAVGASRLDKLVRELHSRKSFPLGSGSLNYLFGFSGGHKLSYALQTAVPRTNGGIEIGAFMRDGAEPTDRKVELEPSTLNLGFLVTGLPGTGKTTEAMAVVDSLLKGAGAPKVAVITPTDEWGQFALAHGMCLVRLYRDMVPINFFRKPDGIDSEKFYENLAMVLSSASGAGPYQNPMEKCMLNAFKKAYAGESEPDPVEVYGEIEDAIVRLHAKRTNSGVKYTKHGENIKSALENLRGILSRLEFCVKKGVKMEDMLERGVVFDISNASGTTRAYLYALLLNQVYAITSMLDTRGDGELRLLICLEEAQTMFGAKESAAVQDMKQRIQDFRKQGVGLMLLAHNVGDVDAGIRRLCQSKLYFKQAPDMAAVAGKDLVFTYAKEEDVTLKMKLLDSRVGAMTYVVKEGSEKIAQDTVFVRTKDYEGAASQDRENPVNGILQRNAIELPKMITAKIHLGRNEKANAIRLLYLGEEIAEYLNDGRVVERRLIGGKTYTLQVLDGRNRVLKEFRIEGRPEIEISD